jgi:hypothetical protein
MEMAYNAKHDAREAATTQDEEGVDLQDKLKEINKKMDLKKKQGLKELKKKLSDIISDESLHASAKLQKLYEENEITEFMQELIN